MGHARHKPLPTKLPWPTPGQLLSSMKPLHALLILGLLGLSACKPRQDEPSASPNEERGTKAARQSAGRPPADPTPLGTLRQLASLPPDRQLPTLSKHIYEIPDEDLDLVLESVFEVKDAAAKRELITVLYEETELRPPTVRLPLLLELARQQEIEPTLQVTILAELGATLRADHGASWADWALAIEEHLAESEGLLRTDQQ